ncbi:hypothetical protein KALB_564 [Kutzneria albida DSM 43870]|uniref:Uncharacterized protein n=1 Tax=Kutzneria albida DSM 43870 TaxID=1449976 RepID=W5VZM1_9PSEU|nr:hypothetical protein KALB_564 [Kutzneria albida DSM 43870]
MNTDGDAERVAAALDQAMRQISTERDWSAWQQVRWLRLRADLLDRLAAEQNGGHGSLARRAELVRDRAERLADRLNGAPLASGETPVVRMWCEEAADL